MSEQEQKDIFEYWKHDAVLLERNRFIADIYQTFRDNPTPQTFFEALVADLILEGVFFYSTFAFFYNLARDQKMMATSQMIRTSSATRTSTATSSAKCSSSCCAISGIEYRREPPVRLRYN